MKLKRILLFPLVIVWINASGHPPIPSISWSAGVGLITGQSSTFIVTGSNTNFTQGTVNIFLQTASGGSPNYSGLSYSVINDSMIIGTVTFSCSALTNGTTEQISLYVFQGTKQIMSTNEQTLSAPFSLSEENPVFVCQGTCSGNGSFKIISNPFASNPPDSFSVAFRNKTFSVKRDSVFNLDSICDYGSSLSVSNGGCNLTIPINPYIVILTVQGELSTPSSPACDGSVHRYVNSNYSGSLSYIWYDSLMNPIGQTTATASGLCSGNYYVKVTYDNQGCSVVAPATVPAATVTSYLIPINQTISFYPNPASDFVHITGTADTGEITITDEHGQVHIAQIIKDFDKIDVSGLAPGVYFLTLKNNNMSRTDKLIIRN